MPSGYVQLFSNGVDSSVADADACNMYIDNLSVTNFDFNKKSTTVDFATNIWHVDDYEYVDSWK